MAEPTPPSSDPQVTQTNTTIVGPVNQAAFQQADPTAANQYDAYVVDTQNKIVAQQTRELEATQGYPASENQIAAINGAAFGTATVAANIRFKDNIEEARAAQSVPTGTPPPTIAAADVNVPALPNDVDPNFIPNPAPVDNTINPEVPQPTAEFAGGKRADPDIVDDPQFPPPQDFGQESRISDFPPPQDFGTDPQVPAAPVVQNYFTDATPAPVENYFTDDTPTPIVQNYFTDAVPVSPAANPQVPEPIIVQNYFVDEPPIVQNYFTDATPIPIVQNYFTDATPVQPASNPQVPNIFSSIASLLANLFGITPTPVAPAANPQVAQAFPVPTPVVLTPTPIPPAANPQVPPQPIVQNYFTDATPAPVVPAANPQVPEPPVVQNYFVDEPPVVQNYFTDATPAPIVQNYFTDATPVVPAANPQVPEPPIVQNYFVDEPAPIVQNYFTDATPAPIVQNYFTDAVPVSPAANPEVPQPPDNTALLAKLSRVLESPAGSATTVSLDADAQIPNPPTKIVAVSTETLLQNDPDTAQEYTAFKNETAEQLTTQRIAEQEAVNGGPISVSEQVRIAARAEIDATADANFRYQDQIEAAGAATVVPADTPPPTPSPTVVVNNPQVVVPPTRVVAVSTETLLQNDPDTAREYTAFKTETAEQLTTQRIAEQEAAQGGPISVSEQVRIAARAEIDATADANFRYQDQIQAAGAGTTVPADTPPPTVVAPTVSPSSDPQVADPTVIVNVGGKKADPDIVDDPQFPLPNDVDPNFIPNTAPVDNTIDPQVPSSANVRVENSNQSQLAATNPVLYQQWQTTFATRAAADAANETKLVEAELGRPVTAEEKATIDSVAAFRARNDTNAIYKDELQAANVATVVPADTPPPTVAAPPVDSATNQQVPPAQTGEPLIDPDTGEVLGYVDTATGEITDAPPAVKSLDNPQVPNTADTTITSVNQTQLSQSNATLSAEYNSAVATNTAATEEQLTTQALATYGVTTPSDLPLDVQLEIREQALTQGVTEANTEFKDQLEASGAATSQPTGTPPPTVAAAPPSPSPYEIFLAQEAAATDAAQAEATARFNSQFDVVDDPQAFPVDDGAAITGTELEPVADNNSGYDEFYGNDTGEFQDLALEPTPTDFTDYDEFYGDDTGEFQDLALEPAVGDGESAGYDEFYGDDTGEFQDLALEPAVGDGESAGYDEFYGDDTGEFQDLALEPAVGDGESAGFGDFFGGVAAGAGGLLKSFAGAVSGAADPQANSAQQFALDSISGLVKSAIKTPNQLAAERQAAAKAQAQAQAQVNAQRKQANEGDWRVRLRLAGGADYLYKAKGANGKSAAGILEPLAVTDGVIFPYTPQITTQYQAKYNPYELTHSNYKGYFYQGSSVNEISINATFTAQDTSEANYLLAVIHFFRSVTKMFYGQDDASKRGAPPPLVFLQGLGEYQFNLHPCVVSNFNYTLPADVDYIRANSVNFDGTNLLQRRDRQNLPIDYVNSVSSRLSNAGLTKGGLNTPPPPPTLGTKSPTYVPTKMEIQLVLLPMQTRSQVSQQFSLKQFASGDLIRGGFW